MTPLDIERQVSFDMASEIHDVRIPFAISSSIILIHKTFNNWQRVKKMHMVGLFTKCNNENSAFVFWRLVIECQNKSTILSFIISTAPMWCFDHYLMVELLKATRLVWENANQLNG